MNNCEDKGIDRSLLKYEKAVERMAEIGQINSPMDDELAHIILDELEPVILTEDEMRRLNADLQRIHQDKAIEKARELLPRERQSFGGYIQFLRNKAGLTIVEIAQRLKIQDSYLENIETNFVNPIEIVAGKIADIMELFRISLTDFIEAVEKSILLIEAKKGKSISMARSSSQLNAQGKATDILQALDNALIEIERKKTPERSIQIDKEYIERVKKELIKRNRNDLTKQ
jgi:transcriptional regulator with XRE-family HTH domain